MPGITSCASAPAQPSPVRAPGAPRAIGDGDVDMRAPLYRAWTATENQKKRRCVDSTWTIQWSRRALALLGIARPEVRRSRRYTSCRRQPPAASPPQARHRRDRGQGSVLRRRGAVGRAAQLKQTRFRVAKRAARARCCCRYATAFTAISCMSISLPTPLWR
jgi:hypothetical protein